MASQIMTAVSHYISAYYYRCNFAWSCDPDKSVSGSRCN